MNLPYLLLGTVLLVAGTSVGEKPDTIHQPTPARVKVQFHYTALSATVQSYVLDQLIPHLRPLAEILDLDVVPCGLTEIITQEDGRLTLICPDGAEECAVNLIHACVYNRYFTKNQMAVLDFIVCYFSSVNYPSNIEQAATQCVEQTFDADAIAPILECARSTVGPALLNDFQDKKVKPLRPHLFYVPWMTVNGKHSYSVEHHIQRTICDTYTGIEKPTDCYLPIPEDPKPDISVHYEVGDASSKSFFANLSPEIISSVANLKFVPFGRSTGGSAREYKCVNDQTCLVYKEHSCLFEVFADYQLETLQVLQCAFDSDQNPDSDSETLKKCVNQVLQDKITHPWRRIQSCVNDKGDALLGENARLVGGLSPVISNVPWVIINLEHNVEAEVNLVNQICSVYYGRDKPDLCKPKSLLEVKIYYETNTGDMSTFFLSQLSSYIEYLDEMGAFSFVPYGRTVYNGSSYVCPHGELQCLANLAHACVLSRFYNSSLLNPQTDASIVANRIQSAEFLLCTAFQVELGSLDPLKDAQLCLNRSFEGDLWPDITSCINGPEGVQLNGELARQTTALSPPPRAFPVVTINGQARPDAQASLFQKLCHTYGNVRPPLCTTLWSHAVPVTIYFSGNAQGLDYLNEQLYPFFKETVPVARNGTGEAALHALITPQLVAWGTTQYDPANTENPFTCAGGENECYINRFLACAKHYHGNEVRGKERVIELTLCFSQNKDQALVDPAGVFNACANRIWNLDPFPQLNACAKDNSDWFKNIFLLAKRRTENNYPALTSFPAVTVNGMVDEFTQGNLLAGVCHHYTGAKPPACGSTGLGV